MFILSGLDVEDNGKCFACGKLNPIGLKLDFVVEGDEYVTYFTPSENHQGWNNIVHGGLVSTVIDEVMVRQAWDNGLKVVTGEISVRFRKPAYVGHKIRFAAKLGRDHGRVVESSAEAVDEDGTVLASSKGKLVKVG